MRRLREATTLDGSARARIARRNRDFIATLSESQATLADEQAYRSYCLLLPLTSLATVTVVGAPIS